MTRTLDDGIGFDLDEPDPLTTEHAWSCYAGCVGQHHLRPPPAERGDAPTSPQTPSTVTGSRCRCPYHSRQGEDIGDTGERRR